MFHFSKALGLDGLRIQLVVQELEEITLWVHPVDILHSLLPMNKQVLATKWAPVVQVTMIMILRQVDVWHHLLQIFQWNFRLP